MRTEKLTKETFGTILKDLLKRSTDSYPEEEKAYYRRMEKDILALRESGFRGVYMVPGSCD